MALQRNYSDLNNNHQWKWSLLLSSHFSLCTGIFLASDELGWRSEPADSSLLLSVGLVFCLSSFLNTFAGEGRTLSASRTGVVGGQAGEGREAEQQLSTKSIQWHLSMTPLAFLSHKGRTINSTPLLRASNLIFLANSLLGCKLLPIAYCK